MALCALSETWPSAASPGLWRPRARSQLLLLPCSVKIRHQSACGHVLGMCWPGEGSCVIAGSTHGQQSRLKGHDALLERRLRDEDGSVNQYRMLVDKVRESIWVGWKVNDWTPEPR